MNRYVLAKERETKPVKSGSFKVINNSVKGAEVCGRSKEMDAKYHKGDRLLSEAD